MLLTLLLSFVKYSWMIGKPTHPSLDELDFTLIQSLQTKHHLSAKGYTFPLLCYHVMTSDPLIFNTLGG